MELKYPQNNGILLNTWKSSETLALRTIIAFELIFQTEALDRIRLYF